MLPDLKGFGSEGFIISIFLYILLVIVLIVLKVIPTSKKAWRNRNDETVKLNPGPRPGNAKECKDHANKLTELEERLDLKTKQICDNIERVEKYNREDHQSIFKKMDNLRDKI